MCVPRELYRPPHHPAHKPRHNFSHTHLRRLARSHPAHAVDCQVVELLTYVLNNSKVGGLA